MLDTDQLRSFVAIVDTGSFTRAAERVHKTQSAVSMHMRRLEERLGCTLFVKDGRGVQISSEGERLLSHARRLLQAEAAAIAAVTQQGLTGRVKLGLPDDYAEAFLARILSAFNHAYPLVEVSVICEASRKLAKRIASQEVELAIVTECVEFSGLEVIREEPLVWVCGQRPAFPLTGLLPLALGMHSCDWRAITIAALQQAGRASRVLLASDNYAAIAPLVRAGLAITVLPLGAVSEDLRIVGVEEGLPNLGLSRLGLLRAASQPSAEAAALAAVIRTCISKTRPADLHLRTPMETAA